MVPKRTPGLVTKPMAALDVLAPASHCEPELDGCEVPASARVGDVPDAYPAMALLFAMSDTVGTSNVSGLLRWRCISRPCGYAKASTLSDEIARQKARVHGEWQTEAEALT